MLPPHAFYSIGTFELVCFFSVLILPQLIPSGATLKANIIHIAMKKLINVPIIN